MNYRLVFRNIGIMSVLMAAAMAFSLLWALPCLGGEWQYERDGVFGLLVSIVLTSLFSWFFLSYGKGSENASMFRREALATVALDWLIAVLIGSLPYIFSEAGRDLILNPDGTITIARMSIADALYESTSGLTTTGSTIVSELEDPMVMPRCILFWRSTTHFIGGLGIVVLLVALLDTGMAGRLLVQRELAEPIQSVFSRTQAVVRRIGIVYLGVNAALLILLLCAGMSVFDALGHAFSAVATGGFGTHNTSLAFCQAPDSGINAPMVEWSVGIFMFISGMNMLLLYFLAIGKWRYLFCSLEWRCYLLIVTMATLGVLCFCSDEMASGGFLSALRCSFFHVVSICTTTGFACADYSHWLPQAQAILILLMFICACSGSTSGGPKIIRYLLLFKIFTSDFERFYRPNIVRPVTFNGEKLNDLSLARGVLLYFAVMGVLLMVIWFLLMLFEPDTLWRNEAKLDLQQGLKTVAAVPADSQQPETSQIAATLAVVSDSGVTMVDDSALALAMSSNSGRSDSQSWDLFCATISHFSNVGPASGVLGPMGNYGSLTWLSKLLLTFCMLVGRLEIFGLLLVFTPAFWRQ